MPAALASARRQALDTSDVAPARVQKTRDGLCFVVFATLIRTMPNQPSAPPAAAEQVQAAAAALSQVLLATYTSYLSGDAAGFASRQPATRSAPLASLLSTRRPFRPAGLVALAVPEHTRCAAFQLLCELRTNTPKDRAFLFRHARACVPQTCTGWLVRLRGRGSPAIACLGVPAPLSPLAAGAPQLRGPRRAPYHC